MTYARKGNYNAIKFLVVSKKFRGFLIDFSHKNLPTGAQIKKTLSLNPQPITTIS